MIHLIWIIIINEVFPPSRLIRGHVTLITLRDLSGSRIITAKTNRLIVPELGGEVHHGTRKSSLRFGADQLNIDPLAGVCALSVMTQRLAAPEWSSRWRLTVRAVTALDNTADLK